MADDMTPRPAVRHLSVALFASSFHPHVGGVEELVRQLAHQQQARGGRPLVVTMRWPKSLPAEEELEGIPVVRHIFRLPERKPRWLAAYALEHRVIQRAINRQLVEHGVEVIHVQCVSGNGWYALRASQDLGLPLIVTLQGELTMDAEGVYQSSSVLPGLLRELLERADAVTACSQHTLDEAQQFTGVTLGERGSVVPNGVNLEELQGAEPLVRAKPYALAIGRHVRQKGFDVLLDVWAEVRRALPEAPDLVIAGDGPERSALETQACSLGLDGSVVFFGRCDRATTVSLFAACVAFVLPSRHEPFGIVNLEAMAAGTPVIATRVGGVPEIITDERDGLLVAPDDSAECAKAITRVFTDPAFADRLARAAQDRATQFDWDIVAASYSRTYSSAATHFARAGHLSGERLRRP